MPEVEGEHVVAEADAEPGRPEVVVGRLPRRVGPHQGDGRGHEQHGTPRRLGGEEVPERADEADAGPGRARTPGHLYSTRSVDGVVNGPN